MSTESNKALVRRFLEQGLGMGNLDVVDELVSPGVLFHVPFPEETPGSEGLKDLAFIFRAAFPDLMLTIDDIVAEGEKVAVRFSSKGTNTGPFLEIPPTGKRITLTLMEFFRIADGKIIEIWGEADLLGLMQQLGAAPPTG